MSRLAVVFLCALLLLAGVVVGGEERVWHQPHLQQAHEAAAKSEANFGKSLWFFAGTRRKNAIEALRKNSANNLPDAHQKKFNEIFGGAGSVKPKARTRYGFRAAMALWQQHLRENGQGAVETKAQSSQQDGGGQDNAETTARTGNQTLSVELRDAFSSAAAQWAQGHQKRINEQRTAATGQQKRQDAAELPPTAADGQAKESDGQLVEGTRSAADNGAGEELRPTVAQTSVGRARSNSLPSGSATQGRTRSLSVSGGSPAARGGFGRSTAAGGDDVLSSSELRTPSFDGSGSSDDRSDTKSVLIRPQSPVGDDEQPHEQPQHDGKLDHGLESALEPAGRQDGQHEELKKTTLQQQTKDQVAVSATAREPQSQAKQEEVATPAEREKRAGKVIEGIQRAVKETLNDKSLNDFFDRQDAPKAPGLPFNVHTENFELPQGIRDDLRKHLNKTASVKLTDEQFQVAEQLFIAQFEQGRLAAYAKDHETWAEDAHSKLHVVSSTGSTEAPAGQRSEIWANTDQIQTAASMTSESIEAYEDMLKKMIIADGVAQAHAGATHTRAEAARSQRRVAVSMAQGTQGNVDKMTKNIPSVGELARAHAALYDNPDETTEAKLKNPTSDKEHRDKILSAMAIAAGDGSVAGGGAWRKRHAKEAVSAKGQEFAAKQASARADQIKDLVMKTWGKNGELDLSPAQESIARGRAESLLSAQDALQTALKKQALLSAIGQTKDQAIRSQLEFYLKVIAASTKIPSPKDVSAELAAAQKKVDEAQAELDKPLDVGYSVAPSEHGQALPHGVGHEEASADAQAAIDKSTDHGTDQRTGDGAGAAPDERQEVIGHLMSHYDSAEHKLPEGVRGVFDTLARGGAIDLSTPRAAVVEAEQELEDTLRHWKDSGADAASLGVVSELLEKVKNRLKAPELLQFPDVRKPSVEPGRRVPLQVNVSTGHSSMLSENHRTGSAAEASARPLAEEQLNSLKSYFPKVREVALDAADFLRDVQALQVIEKYEQQKDNKNARGQSYDADRTAALALLLQYKKKQSNDGDKLLNKKTGLKIEILGRLKDQLGYSGTAEDLGKNQNLLEGLAQNIRDGDFDEKQHQAPPAADSAAVMAP